MSEKTDIQRLADRLATTVESARLRIGTVTAVETTTGAHDVQLDITDAAWVSRPQDAVLAVGDRVWVVQEGPIFVVGGRLSGSVPAAAFRSKAATQSNASTTLVDDADLYVDLTPGTFRIELFINASNTDTGDGVDIRSTWTTTGTITSVGRAVVGPGVASTNTVADTTSAGSGVVRSTAHNLTTVLLFGITDDGTTVFKEDLVLVVTAAGRLQWRWGQGTASATATTVGAGSRLLVSPIQAL